MEFRKRLYSPPILLVVYISYVPKFLGVGTRGRSTRSEIIYVTN